MMLHGYLRFDRNDVAHPLRYAEGSGSSHSRLASLSWEDLERGTKAKT